MLRVKDIEKSLKFYQDVLGMTFLRKNESPSSGFNLYFLGYPGKDGAPADGDTSKMEGLLELTWNYGTEKDEGLSYHNGNDEPQGFGHICAFASFPSTHSLPSLLQWLVVRRRFPGIILLTRGWGDKGVSVDNLDAACQRFEDLNCSWKKRLTDGRMKTVAFLLDPDNYWVEVIQNEKFTVKSSF